MNTTIVLAHILGISFVILGLAMLLNKGNMSAVMDTLVSNKAILCLTGFVTLMLGAILVVLNNTWTSGLPLLVTILGWMMLIKGAFLLLLPNTAAAYYKRMNTNGLFIWAGLLVLVLGIVLLV